MQSYPNLHPHLKLNLEQLQLFTAFATVKMPWMDNFISHEATQAEETPDSKS